MEFDADWLIEAIKRHEVYKDGKPTGTVKIGNAIALIQQSDLYEVKEELNIDDFS